MALTATMYRLQVSLSDVDRGVYETIELRLARHPSETMRYLLTRALAYGLSYEEGIAFSKEGISSTEEPPVFVRDPTGLLTAWIEIGAPSAERLHKAAKAAPRVSVFTSTPLALLQKEAASRSIHRVEHIEVFRIEPSFLDALAEKIERNTALEILRNDGSLYVTVGGAVVEGTIERCSLLAD